MSPPAIRLLVEVYVAEDVRDAVITGTVTDADVRSDALDAGDEAVRAFSGHLGLITAVELAIGAAVGRRGTEYTADTAYRRNRGDEDE